jgi:hypothetical protein
MPSRRISAAVFEDVMIREQALARPKRRACLNLLIHEAQTAKQETKTGVEQLIFVAEQPSVSLTFE